MQASVFSSLINQRQNGFQPFTCTNPQYIRNPYSKELLVVPCRHCEACMLRRMQSWKNKLEIENSNHRFSMFGTLSYNEDFVPRMSLDEFRQLGDYDEIIGASKDYLSVYNNKILFCRSKDFSNFIKRLRTLIFRTYGESICLRFFCCSEYGSTTYRPHFHFILWFDDRRLFSQLSRLVLLAWTYYDRATRTRVSLGNIDFEPVKTSCSGYVTSYITSLQSLPPVLSVAETRAKFLYSNAPAIGSQSISAEMSESIIANLSPTYTLKTLKGSVYSLSLPRAFEDRFFPRITGFSDFNDYELLYLYRASSGFTSSSRSIAENFERYELKRLSGISVVRSSDGSKYKDNVIRRYISKCYCDEVDALSKLFRLSRRFLDAYQHLSSIGLYTSQLDYIHAIQEYYKKKDYTKLCEQLRFEQQCAAKHIRIPASIIDPLCFTRSQSNFYHFKSFDTFYDWNPPANKNRFFSEFLRESSLSYKSHCKTKLNEDYMRRHPQFYKLHKKDF